jgi:hypothetical protein
MLKASYSLYFNYQTLDFTINQFYKILYIFLFHLKFIINSFIVELFQKKLNLKQTLF